MMLRRACRLAVLAAVLARAPSARAQAESDSVSVRLRAGIGLPSGGIDKSHDLSGTYGVLIPVDLEAGYWVVPQLFVGAHGAFGILTIADEGCAPPLECSGTDIRFGADVEYRLDLTGSFRKWASLGVGYELARFAIRGGGGSASRTDSGPEYLHLQVGGDWSIGTHFGVGPYVGLTIAEFRTAAIHQADGSEGTYKIQDRRLHEWFLVGVRGVWTL